ncbi:NADH dehydrogenase I chain L [Aquifex aeolicus VF5]|uniref:NADH dehydrogenase I chain L n=2 Tax=Aquifex aeolicus TaxID=63363 RepID=O67340_AQUAE|nr:NADH dehydrogenase I chain L [Aquifex aeolicus VF5]
MSMMVELGVIFTPLIAFLIILLFGRKIGDLGSGIIASVGAGLTTLFSLVVALKAIHSPVHVKLYDFLPIGNYTLSLGFYFDSLSSLMALVVTFVATLIFVYSIGYMRDEFGKWVFKFYAYLSLFLFAMLLIVLSDNLLGIFFGWEGVGLASYLLIGYYHEQKKATKASFEAFVMNRIGDWLFIFGIIYSFYLFKTLEITQIFPKVEEVDKYALGVATMLLFGGAVGKSGQFPLHTWLPNAMAGPTPVSALLHAATMVAAGVYMVARLYPMFEATPQTLKLIVLIGAITMTMAALAGAVHNDIKKIIAFSTMSQLGYMFVALGVGDKGGAMFHLTTHAFFKALLFLAAGAVITAFHHHLYDIFKMGGLKKYMPVTYVAFMIGALSLAGVFPFSGFWSKDRIVASMYEWSGVLGVLGTIVAFITAYYAFREGFLVFHGRERWREIYDKDVHEVEGVMTVPMGLLGFLTVLTGLFGLWLEHWYVGLIGGEEKGIHLSVALVSLGVAIAGIWLPWPVYVKKVIDYNKAYESLKFIHTTFKEQFFTEKLYHNVVAGGYLTYSRSLYSTVERLFIDGIVNATYPIVELLGSVLKFFQNGRLSWYVMGLATGLTIIVLILFAITIRGGL